MVVKSRKKITQDQDTLASIIHKLKDLGFNIIVKKGEDSGQYELQRKMTNKSAINVGLKHPEEVNEFVQCLAERSYNLETIDHDIICYHLAMHLDDIGKDLYSELCSEAKNISYFYNYVYFIDYLLKKKHSKQGKRTRLAVIESGKLAYDEIEDLKQFGYGLIDFFEEVSAD